MGEREDPDDLDALLAGYEAQAQQDIDDVQRRTRDKGKARQPPKARLQAALDTPIDQENK